MRGAIVVASVLVVVAVSPAVHAQLGRIPIPLPGQTARATPFDLEIGRGDQALRRGEFAEAEQHFHAAAQLNSRDARPAFYLGEVAFRRSDLSGAERQLRAAIQINAQMAEAHAELGNVLREQHRLPDAVTSLETAIRLDPTLGEAHYALALTLEDQGQRERALTEYRSAVRLSPDSPMPAVNLGILLVSLGAPAGSSQRAEALRVLQAGIRNANGDRDVLASAGPALRAIGEYAGAVSALDRARTAGTPTAAILAELAQALWAQGNQALALQRMSEALALEPRRGDLYYLHALMLAGQGDRSGAVRELEHVLRASPDADLAGRARTRLRQIRGAGH